MRSVAPIFLCLLVLCGALCPAFCLSSADTHACCRSKAGSHGKMCSHSAGAQAQGRSVAAIPVAVPTVQISSAHSEAIARPRIVSSGTSPDLPDIPRHRVLRI